MLTTALHLVAVGLGAILVFLTLPLLVELLVLSTIAAFPGHRRGDHPHPEFRLAVLIPAHNEQHLIAECVNSVLEQANHLVDVYVVAHNCADSTASLARAAGAHTLVLNDPVGGKGTALDHGFRHALAHGAQGVLVIDADTAIGPNLLRAVSAAFVAGAGALQCRYQVSNANATPRTRLAALAFLGMDVLRPLGRSRLGLSCGIFGNGFALSADTLNRVPYVANSIVEDLEYHLHLIRAGIPVRFLSHASVFAEMPETAAASVSQKARWEMGRTQMRRLWTPQLLRAVFSGKLHMLEPLIDLVALPLATQTALLVLALLLALPAHLTWLGLYAGAGFFSVLLYLMVAASLSPEPRVALRSLAGAPAFVVWKLIRIPHARVASRTADTWVRTKRNAESADTPIL